MNEPYIYTLGGYDLGKLAPGRCSSWMNNGCPDGNSATEPYIVAHVMLLCHAQTVKLYREKYKMSQKGQIGIVLISFWFVPYSKSQADVRAAQRALDFMFGCNNFAPILIQLLTVDYPKSMRTLVGDRLPNFTDEEANLVKGSYDFLGINYYTSFYATGIPEFRVYPRGLKDLLIYTKQKYKNPSIYITECGMSEANITTIERGTNDPQRIRFYRRHLLAVRQAI
ncbi:beta-glucosidase 12-like, partial [Olea europaea subsp. europaea]